jgi:aspartate aminotransferase
VEAMRKEFDERRKLVLAKLAAIPGLKVSQPEGAFYAFFDVSSYFGKTFGGVQVKDSNTFCNTLLEQAHVNLVTGDAFGANGFVRMSFACSRENIEGGLKKLAEWLASGK